MVQAAIGSPAAGLSSLHVGSLTFWDGRQPIVGSVGAAWAPAPSATSATAAAEELQQQRQQQEE